MLIVQRERPTLGGLLRIVSLNDRLRGIGEPPVAKGRRHLYFWFGEAADWLDEPWACDGQQPDPKGVERGIPAAKKQNDQIMQKAAQRRARFLLPPDRCQQSFNASLV
jgi:hypothetical protein